MNFIKVLALVISVLFMHASLQAQSGNLDNVAVTHEFQQHVLTVTFTNNGSNDLESSIIITQDEVLHFAGGVISIKTGISTTIYFATKPSFSPNSVMRVYENCVEEVSMEEYYFIQSP